MLQISIFLIIFILIIWIILRWPLRLILEWSCTKDAMYQRFSLRLFKLKFIDKQKTNEDFGSLKDVDLSTVKKRIETFLKDEQLQQQITKFQRLTSLQELSLMSEVGFKSPIQTSMSVASIWMLNSILLRSLWQRIKVPEEAKIDIHVEPNFEEETFFVKLRFEGKVTVKEMLRMYIMLKNYAS